VVAACAPGWRENLHVAADIAVILAVLVGAIALVVQLRERRSRRAAVDVRLRTGALRAHRRLHPALGYQPPAEPGQEGRARLSALLASIGEPMDDMLRALAADAPEASSALERTISDAYAAYWHARTGAERVLLAGQAPDMVIQQVLGEFERCAALLKNAAGPKLLP
jgi:hypothetical protein